MICPHCAGSHSIKDCNNKEDPPTCSNCGVNHRATSNTCNYKKKYLAIPPSNNVITQFFKNPESNYTYPAPPPTTNPWVNRTNKNNINTNNNNSSLQNNSNQINLTTLSPTRGKSINRPNPFQNNLPSTSSNTSNQYATLPMPEPTDNNNINSQTIQNQENTGAIPKNKQQPPLNNNNTFHNVSESGNNVYIHNVQPNPKPIISYNECLIMAKQFEHWPTAFTELQFAFGISPVIAIPTSLHNKMKFVDCINTNSNPTINQNNNVNSNNHTPVNSNSQTTTNINCNNTNQNKPESNHNSSQINNNLNIETSINNLIKNNREPKDNKTAPKISNTSSTALTINQRQYNTYNKNNAEVGSHNKNDSTLTLKDAIMFTTAKNNNNKLDPIPENQNSPNSSSSSIDGNILICEDSNSSITSNDDTVLENNPITSTPINQGMGRRTRSQTSLCSSDNIHIQNYNNKTKS